MSVKQSQTQHENDIKFQTICAEYRNAYPQVSKPTQQAEPTKLWNEIKSKSREYDNVIRELKQKATRSKAKLTSFFIKAQTVQKKRAPSAEDSSISSSASTISSSASTSSSSTSAAPASSSASAAPASSSASTSSSALEASQTASTFESPSVVSLKRKAPAPMQEKLEKDIADKKKRDCKLPSYSGKDWTQC